MDRTSAKLLTGGHYRRAIAGRVAAAVVAAGLLCSCGVAPYDAGSADSGSTRARSGAPNPDAVPPSAVAVAGSTGAAQPGTRRAPGSATLAMGTQYNGTWTIYTDAQRERILNQLVAAGVQWVRIDVSWATLQPNSAGYDMKWAVPFYDRVFAQARAKGLKILGTFWQAPRWANGSSNPDTPPKDPQKFAGAAAWVAKRWSSKIAAWEIWNEPNSGDFFVGNDPIRYTRLLCATYPAIKRANPGSAVVFGGLMYNDDAWLRRAYAAGAHGCFDVMATHPYEAPASAPPGTADDGTTWHLTHVTAVHNLMVANGDGAKPIWFTELGWSSAEPVHAKPWDTGVSEQTQAAYLTKAAKLTASRYPYVKVMIWFRDAEQKTGDVHEDHYGLLRADLSPKPALAAIRALNGR